MDTSKGLALWVAGFGGVLIIYAAFKDVSPIKVITSALQGKPQPVADVTTSDTTTQPASNITIDSHGLSVGPAFNDTNPQVGKN